MFKMSSKRKLKKICLLLKLKKIIEEYEIEKCNEKVFKRSCCIKPQLMQQSDLDIEAHLLKDLLWEDDVEDLNNYCQLNINQFEQILSLVEPQIKKRDTHMRAAISARIKLAITLKYLSTGDSFSSLAFLAKVSTSAISLFIPKVARALYDSLKKDYLKIPNTEEEWLDIAKDFNDIWQFPHTLGSLDGKHIRIKASSNSGSQFYNFKGFYTIVLFAAVDAHCRFIFVDVGSNGKACDSTIYQDSYLYNSIENGNLNIPISEELTTCRGSKIPYYFIAGDTFSLDKNLMVPFSQSLKVNIQQEVFNYRLCRARMVVECAFGRLARRFGIYNRPIEVNPSTVNLIVMTTCVLHNYLTNQTNRPVTEDNTMDIEDTPATFTSIGQQSYETHKYADRIRDEVSKYLVTDGNVDF